MADERNDNKGAVSAALPTDALKDAGQQLLGLLVQQAAEAATQRVSGLADRLTGVSESGGDLRTALRPDRAESDGQGDGGEGGEGEDKPGGIRGAWRSLKEKVKNVFG